MVGSIKKRLERLLSETCATLAVELMALEVMPDHLHMFVSASPTLSVPVIVKMLKGRSSRVLRTEYSHLKRMPSLWTSSYFVSTAGNVSSETVKRYIEAQGTR